MLQVPSPISPLTSYSRSRVPIASVCAGIAGGAARTASSSESGVIVVNRLLPRCRRGAGSRTTAAARRAALSGLGIVARTMGPGRHRGAAAGATKSRHCGARRRFVQRCSGRGGRPAAEHAVAFHRQHGLVVLVHHLPARAQDADVRAGSPWHATRAPRAGRAACRRDRPASSSSASRARASRGSPTRAGRRRTSCASRSRRCASRSRRDGRTATLRRRRRRDGRAAGRTRARRREPLRG